MNGPGGFGITLDVIRNTLYAECGDSKLPFEGDRRAFSLPSQQAVRGFRARRIAEAAPTSRCDGASSIGFAPWQSPGGSKRRAVERIFDSDQRSPENLLRLAWDPCLRSGDRGL